MEALDTASVELKFIKRLRFILAAITDKHEQEVAILNSLKLRDCMIQKSQKHLPKRRLHIVRD